VVLYFGKSTNNMKSILLITIVLMGCTGRKTLIPQTPILVEIPKNLLNSECISEYSGYFDLFNYRISNYYSISQQIVLKIDDNQFLDHLVILTPKFNAGPNDYCIPSGEIPQKLLVVFRANNSDSLEVKIYDKVLSNLDWNLMFERLSALDHKFVIEGTYGHSNNSIFMYLTTIGYIDGEYYVENINYEISGRIQKKHSIMFKQKEFGFGEYTSDFVFSHVDSLSLE
jgi:hypothetical protein